mmetsp:Transcript_11151/g.47552  ORF Transcript_11151/g.47552 Transcript_11151/m.47552 type:complete len:209 (+) Transcript_11151:549-1175(+)
MALVNAVSPLEMELPTFPETLFFLSNSDAFWYAEVAPAVSLPVMLYLVFTSFALFAAAAVASYSFPVMLCSSLNFFAAVAVAAAACPVCRATSPTVSLRVVAYAAPPAATTAVIGPRTTAPATAPTAAAPATVPYPPAVFTAALVWPASCAPCCAICALCAMASNCDACSLPCRTPARLRYSDDFPRISAASAGVTEAARSRASAARV